MGTAHRLQFPTAHAAPASSLISPLHLIPSTFILGFSGWNLNTSSSSWVFPHLIRLPCLGSEASVKQCAQHEKPNWESGSALVSVLTHTSHSRVHPSLQTHPHQPSTGRTMLSFSGFWHKNVFPSGISHWSLQLVTLPWESELTNVNHSPLKLRELRLSSRSAQCLATRSSFHSSQRELD